MVNDTRNELAALDRHLHEGREQDPHLLREVMRLHQAMMAGFSRQTGMTATRFALMRLVARAGDAGIGVMDLARRLGVNAAAVTRQVQDMEQDGLIRRRPEGRCDVRHHPRAQSRARAGLGGHRQPR
jgi:predicted Rossmann fold nucleotide-binding protein DprA/Smf involved in DNA uptake